MKTKKHKLSKKAVMKEIKTGGKNYDGPEQVRDLDKEQIRHLISETDNTQFIPPKSCYRHFVL